MNKTMDKKVAELIHDLTANHVSLGRKESIYSRAIEMIEQLDSALAVTVESRSILLESQACPHCGPNCDLLPKK